MYTGNCLCGGVRFQISGTLEPIQICHCSQCRRAQGSAFAANTPVAAEAFLLLSGTDLLSEFEATPGKARVFCGRCGSPVFSKKIALPGVLRVRAGLINEPLPLGPVAHCYASSKANWWAINDDLPRYEGPYPATG